MKKYYSRTDVECMLKGGMAVIQIMNETGLGKSWIYEIKNRMQARSC